MLGSAMCCEDVGDLSFALRRALSSYTLVAFNFPLETHSRLIYWEVRSREQKIKSSFASVIYRLPLGDAFSISDTKGVFDAWQTPPASAVEPFYAKGFRQPLRKASD